MSDWLKKIEDIPLSFQLWAATFGAVVLVRAFWEGFSIPFGTFAAADAGTVVHYGLFYLGTLLSIMLLLEAVLGRAALIVRAGILGVAIIWLAPLLDLLFWGGSRMTYLFVGPGETLGAFFGFLTPWYAGGASPGVKIELDLLLLGVYIFSFAVSRKLSRAILAAAGTYLILFAWGAAPTWLGWEHRALFPSGGTLRYLQETAEQSFLAKNVLPALGELPRVREGEVLFNAVMGQVFYLISTALAAAFALRFFRGAAGAVLRNSRWERVGHFWLMIAFGAWLAVRQGASPAWNWLDWTSLASLGLAFYCAWMWAVGINDISDQAVDQITNSSRPLPRGTLGESDVRQFNAFFLIWAIIGGFLAGGHSLLFVLVYLGLAWLYSMPPFRLHRLPGISSLAIAAASLSAALAGFYLLSPDPTGGAFPPIYFALILCFFTLFIPIKDLKDERGDHAAGIRTFANMLAYPWNRRLTGLLWVAAFLCVPIFMGIPSLWWPSLLAGLAGFWFIERKTWKETPLFIIYAAYVLAFVLLVG